MTPREIDAQVAEKVMGYRWWDEGHAWRGFRVLFPPEEYAKCDTDDVPGYTLGAGPLQHVPHYSTDIGAAWQVVEKMNEAGWWLTELRQKVVGYKWGVEFVKEGEWMNIDGHQLAGADTAQMAICLATLRTQGVEV